MPGSALKVPGWVGGWVVGQAPTHVEVELGCDNINIAAIYHSFLIVK